MFGAALAINTHLFFLVLPLKHWWIFEDWSQIKRKLKTLLKEALFPPWATAAAPVKNEFSCNWNYPDSSPTAADSRQRNLLRLKSVNDQSQLPSQARLSQIRWIFNEGIFHECAMILLKLKFWAFPKESASGTLTQDLHAARIWRYVVKTLVWLSVLRLLREWVPFQPRITEDAGDGSTRPVTVRSVDPSSKAHRGSAGPQPCSQIQGCNETEAILRQRTLDTFMSRWGSFYLKCWHEFMLPVPFLPCLKFTLMWPWCFTKPPDNSKQCNFHFLS